MRVSRYSAANACNVIPGSYAHSSSVFAWEFFNEVDITDDYTSAVQAAWVAEMADYVHEIDPYRHLVSTSFCCTDERAVL